MANCCISWVVRKEVVVIEISCEIEGLEIKEASGVQVGAFG